MFHSKLFFPKVFIIQLALIKVLNIQITLCITKMTIQMNKKFKNYWSKYSSILAIKVIFGPRYNIQFMEFSNERVYDGTYIEMMSFFLFLNCTSTYL